MFSCFPLCLVPSRFILPACSPGILIPLLRRFLVPLEPSQQHAVSFLPAAEQCCLFVRLVDLLSKLSEEKSGRGKLSVVKVIRSDSPRGPTPAQILLCGHEGHHAKRSWRVTVSPGLQGLGQSSGPLRSRGSRALPELSVVTLIRLRGASPGQGQEKHPENMSPPVTLAPCEDLAALPERGPAGGTWLMESALCSPFTGLSPVSLVLPQANCPPAFPSLTAFPFVSSLLSSLTPTMQTADRGGCRPSVEPNDLFRSFS